MYPTYKMDDDFFYMYHLIEMLFYSAGSMMHFQCVCAAIAAFSHNLLLKNCEREPKCNALSP